MITITRKFEFEAAHRILGHQGKCKYLHGHSYVALVTLTSVDINELGMVVDFGKMKEEIGNWIDYYWDHNCILNNNDPLFKAGKLLAELGHFSNQWAFFEGKAPYILLDKNPTAEVLVEELFNVVKDLADKNVFGPANQKIQVVSTRIFESPKCWADYINPKFLFSEALNDATDD